MQSKKAASCLRQTEFEKNEPPAVYLTTTKLQKQINI